MTQKDEYEDDGIVLDVSDKSNMVAFIAGILLTLFFVGIGSLIICFYIQHKRKQETKRLVMMLNLIQWIQRI